MKTMLRVLRLIYVNFWYIPLLLFLLGLKICLLFFLVTSIHPDEGFQKPGTWAQVNVNSQNGSWQQNLKSLGSPLGKKLHRKVEKRKSSSTTTEIPQELIEEWETLTHLNQARIKPTYENRTHGDSIWLVFNRVPRSGGSTLVELLEELGPINGFSHQPHEYRTPWPRFLLEQEQESLVTWFEYQHLPKSYDRHFFFVNFTRYQKFTKEKPIYINIVRDPVMRIRSEFHARRADKELAKMEIIRRNVESPGSGLAWYKMTFEDCVIMEEEECQYENGTPDFTLAVPFFCGQYNSCVAINDKWGAQMAKFNLERSYSVVGVLERMDQTLAVLENYVPKFFAGVTQIYNQLDRRGKGHFVRKEEKTRRDRRRPLSEKVRQILERKLYAEIDLYRFAVQRLSLQYAHLSGSDRK